MHLHNVADRQKVEVESFPGHEIIQVNTELSRCMSVSAAGNRVCRNTEQSSVLGLFLYQSGLCTHSLSFSHVQFSSLSVRFSVCYIHVHMMPACPVPHPCTGCNTANTNELLFGFLNFKSKK